MSADPLTGTDWSLPGSPGYPSGQNTQVNPSYSVVSDELTGSPNPPIQGLGLLQKVPSSIKSPSPVEPEGQVGVEPVNASVLAWPADPAWASRWQHKLDTARTPADRAHIAWRALRAAVHKARADLDPEVEAELWGQVTAWLVGCITDPSTAPPPTTLHARGSAGAPRPHRLEDGIITPTRTCTCSYCTSFYEDLDA